MELPQIQVTVDVIIWDENKEHILLIQRAQDSPANPGYWALPGGLVEEDETIEQAAVRETLEETGLPVKVGFLKYIDWPLERDPRKRSISFIFHGSLPEGSQNMKAGGDASNVKWFTLDEIENMNLAFDHKDIILSINANVHR